MKNLQKSKGHLMFLPGLGCGTVYEYFERNGNVFRAPDHNVFDLDGYRHGRWECQMRDWERLKSLLTREG